MMKSLYRKLFECQLVWTFISVVDADYTVTIELQSYQNPSHMRAQSNDCCDGGCNDPCDNRFRFCYSDSIDVTEHIGILEVRPEEAVIGCQFASGLVAADNDNITFQSGRIFGENTRNPLTFQGDIWPGKGHLLIIVFDVDDETLDDTVDAILVPIIPSSLRRFSKAEIYNGVFGYGKFQARYKVNCVYNFFGADCSVLCVERDDADGHYDCDHDGNKMCLEGYRNTSTDCTECVTATGCSPVGGYCSLPGECICLPGFTGINCTEEAVSATSSDSQTSVQALGAVIGILVFFILLMILLIIILIVCHKRRGKVSSTDERSSRGYYMNDGLGPAACTTVDVDDNTDGMSRQYATVDSNQRLASTVNRVMHDILSERSSSSTTATSPSIDVPTSFLRANIAYGIEQKQNKGRIVNGIRAPMRPPPRPPH